MKNQKKAPFGLNFLKVLPEEALGTVNGGRHHKKQPPLITMHVSMPQPAFPQGDNG
jgi:hypothetical protein